MAEEQNYGFIAGVRARDIYYSLSEKGNRGSLEAILKADKEARKKLPFWGNAGTRVKKKDIGAVFDEAKASVDNFFSLEIGQCNPEIYAKSFLFGYHGLIGLAGMLIGSRLMHAYPPLPDNFPFLQDIGSQPIITALGELTLIAGIVGLCRQEQAVLDCRRFGACNTCACVPEAVIEKVIIY